MTYFRRRLLQRRLPRRALRVYKSLFVPSASVATNPVKVFRAIGRHTGVALLLSFHPVRLRCDAPVEDVTRIQGVEDAQRALALQPSGTGVPTYTPHSTLVEQFSSQVSTTYRCRARLCLFSLPHHGSELLRAASSFKRRRDSWTLRSAVQSAAFLFVVFVVAGPSDLCLCLTGALHNKSGLPT